MNTPSLAKDDYSNRELDSKFDSIIVMLSDIKTQTTKTNGRVTKLERNMLVVAIVTGSILVLKFPEVMKVLLIFI